MKPDQMMYQIGNDDKLTFYKFFQIKD